MGKPQLRQPGSRTVPRRQLILKKSNAVIPEIVYRESSLLLAGIRPGLKK